MQPAPAMHRASPPAALAAHSLAEPTRVGAQGRRCARRWTSAARRGLMRSGGASPRPTPRAAQSCRQPALRIRSAVVVLHYIYSAVRGRARACVHTPAGFVRARACVVRCECGLRSVHDRLGYATLAGRRAAVARALRRARARGARAAPPAGGRARRGARRDGLAAGAPVCPRNRRGRRPIKSRQRCWPVRTILPRPGTHGRRSPCRRSPSGPSGCPSYAFAPPPPHPHSAGDESCAMRHAVARCRRAACRTTGFAPHRPRAALRCSPYETRRARQEASVAAERVRLLLRSEVEAVSREVPQHCRVL